MPRVIDDRWGDGADVVNVTAAADGVVLGVVLEAVAETTRVPATSGRSRTAISTAAPGARSPS